MAKHSPLILQVGKFMMPLADKLVHYEDEKEMYWHIGEDDVRPVNFA